MDARRLTQDEHYARAAADFGAALSRLARAYERDADRQRDLLQDIHFALWRSFESFRGLSSLRTWVYRVAHNTAATHVLRGKRARTSHWVDLEEAANAPDPVTLGDPHAETDTLTRLLDLIHQLKPPDRQVMLLYLDGLDAKETAEITGLSPGAVATRIHRTKALLARRFNADDPS
ncbi:MAG: RNA polymerase subunit sigma-24 [Alphaproteobacteria bacterium 32-64-14]|nr:MAG: RNA polymerase subunit sigma-24 [Alphaproteobacteria bacterium 32-64-14]